MSLHILLTDEAEKTRKRNQYKSFIFSVTTTVLSCTLLGIMFYLSVIILSQPEPTSIEAVYISNNNDDPTLDTPKLPEVNKAIPQMSPNVSFTSVIQSTSPSEMSFASVDIPNMDATLGEAIELGPNSFGTISTRDLGTSGTGLGDASPSGSTLEGTFYDAKQTSGGRSTNMTTEEFSKLLQSFVMNGWSERVWNKFYKSPQKLYASQFIINRISASEAPKAYKCEDRVQPSMWAAIYRGKVIAPKSGSFRFVGYGDDVLAVRFNQETVFDYGWYQASQAVITTSPEWKAGMLNQNKDMAKRLSSTGINIPPVTFYQYQNTGHINQNLGGFAAGKTFKVEAGKAYPIEILISEIPGGEFGFALLIEEVGGNFYKKDPSGAPILPLFKTNYAETPKSERDDRVPFEIIAPIWESVK